METHIAAGIAGAVLGGFVAVMACNIIHGRDNALKAQNDAVALQEAQAEAYKRGQAAQADADRIGQDVTTKDEAQKIVFRTITEKVPVYVTAKTDTAFALAMGLVRVHDAAFAADPGRLTESPGVDNDSPSGVKDTDAASVFAYNGEVCNEAFIRLDGAQAYIRNQYEISHQPAKSAH